jgi:hypothetical protein
MENRYHERYPLNLDATLTDIGEPSHAARGYVVNVSESGVCVEVTLMFRVDAVVKLALPDSALFGHVAHCTPHEGKYRVGIEVIRVLIGDSDLARLVNSILAETMPHTPGVQPK